MKKQKEELEKLLKEKRHDLYLFETSPENHIGEKRAIPALKTEIEMLKEEIKNL